jgi:23S rRNA pseudouridine1911/1915/1917 synthase
LIAEGQITVNGKRTKAGVRLRINDRVIIQALPSIPSDLLAEPIALNVIYEDEDCLVINKAPGMIVHPAAGKRTGTLVNAILHRCPALQPIGGEHRPGIVHRLDKDTSGVMVVGKTAQAIQQLVRQFKDRQVKKEYVALVWGRLKSEQGTVDRPIGRHRSDRKRMSSICSAPKRRDAVTDWRVEKCFRSKNSSIGSSWVSLLRLTPRTGRTHQIRVHLADLGYPLVGDKVYGRRQPKGPAKNGSGANVGSFPRQALHAERLGIIHPRSGRAMEFYAPLPEDMAALLESLESDPDYRVGEIEINQTKGVDKKRAFT